MAKRAKRYGNGLSPFRGPRTISYRRWDGEQYSTFEETVPDCTWYNGDIKRAMGCDPKRHWPDEGVEDRWVCNFLVKVLPKADKKREGRRCVARCNSCERWVCAGHLGQHLAACKEG